MVWFQMYVHVVLFPDCHHDCYCVTALRGLETRLLEPHSQATFQADVEVEGGYHNATGISLIKFHGLVQQWANLNE